MSFKTSFSLIALGAILFTGCSTLEITKPTSSKLSVGKSISARSLECCLPTNEAIERKIHDHIERLTIFDAPDENNDFGLTWTVEGQGNGINKGVHTLVLNYKNLDKTNPEFGNSSVKVKLPFIVLNPESGQHTISFIIDSKLDVNVEKNKASLVAPLEMILEDAKRIQNGDDFKNGPKVISTDLATAKKVTIGHSSILENSDGKVSQHIIAYDAAGKRIVVDQLIDNDGYRMIKNGSKAFLVDTQIGQQIIPPQDGVVLQ